MVFLWERCAHRCFSSHKSSPFYGKLAGLMNLLPLCKSLISLYVTGTVFNVTLKKKSGGNIMEMKLNQLLISSSRDRYPRLFFWKRRNHIYVVYCTEWSFQEFELRLAWNDATMSSKAKLTQTTVKWIPGEVNVGLELLYLRPGYLAKFRQMKQRVWEIVFDRESSIHSEPVITDKSNTSLLTQNNVAHYM